MNDIMILLWLFCLGTKQCQIIYFEAILHQANLARLYKHKNNSQW